MDKSMLAPATMPFGTAKGVVTKKILTNGTIFFCHHADCDYQGERFAQVFAHLGAHNPNGKGHGGRLPGNSIAEIKDLPGLRKHVEGMLVLIDGLTATNGSAPAEPMVPASRLETERKARKAAERKLAGLRRALA